MKIRKDLSPEKIADKTADEDKATKGDEEEQMLNEMEELANALERKKKRKKKLLAKRRAKVWLLYASKSCFINHKICTIQ